MNKTLASNKKANLKYQKVECFEAGVKLLGTEVKSVKAGRASLDGAYVIIRGGEAYLVDATIPAWQAGNVSKSYEVNRPRKLLLSKNQLLELGEYEGRKGLAIVAFSLYNKKGLIKLELCVGKNKNQRDRRQDIKKRDTQRDLKREIKYR